MEHDDILLGVVAELEKRTGDLRKVADDTGIAYDTVLRIKNREGDPGYSKVRVLANHFGLFKLKPKRTPKPAKVEG